LHLKDRSYGIWDISYYDSSYERIVSLNQITYPCSKKVPGGLEVSSNQVMKMITD
jgi:hypothetical protein